MLDNYPKTFNLKDGTSIILRPMTRDDEHDIYMFFSSLPEETRRYLRNDVTNRKIIAGWMRELNYDLTLPILAEHEGNIIAITTLHRQYLWVGPTRRRGAGRAQAGFSGTGPWITALS